MKSSILDPPWCPPLQFQKSSNVETKFHKSRLKGGSCMQMRIDWEKDARVIEGKMHQGMQVYSGKGTSAWSGREASFTGASCISAGEKHKHRNAQPVCRAWLSSIKTQFPISFLSIFLLLLSLCAGQPVPYSPLHPSGFCKGAKIVTMPHCTLQLPSIQLSEK